VLSSARVLGNPTMIVPPVWSETKSIPRRDKLLIGASTMPICVKGADGTTRTLDSNEGLSSWYSSRSNAQGLTAHVILAAINKRLPNVDGAFIITILPSSIIGIGNAGGFKMLKDKKDLGPAALEAAAQELAAVANTDLRLSGVFTPFTAPSCMPAERKNRGEALLPLGSARWNHGRGPSRPGLAVRSRR
jgi:hypothetical protein